MLCPRAARRTALAIGICALALAPRPARAQQATSEVRATVDQVLRILQDPAFKGPAHAKERRARIKEVVLQRFGFAEMARRALGTEWAARTPEQRKEYVDLFTDLLARSYISRIEAYSGQKIVYNSESVDGDRAEVRSEIIEDHDRTKIVYRLVREPSGWQVYDLVIDGVSLVNNYRTQFGQIVGNEGYDGLVKRMQDKRASLEQEDQEERSEGTRSRGGDSSL